MGASAVELSTEGLTPKQRTILQYLRERVDQETYFKSRLIGKELGFSAKEVGSNMRAVADAEHDLDIEQWGYSSSTTWQVTTA
ncbi:DUF7123 family protein [Halodesulfurarchaeum formicicum]|uniref:DUF7123 domain-containing protein n=1 Tax=Halodesulfurarchaeum formicicum TaxID=1873524 RepID=A0A1J1ACR9_9EURY|nr:hypothetical protein [Halodesulfurarchaeum formicicum]APE95948.1 hypothetical protein HSR6_1505 [Halodesulfurarchaeum formicicum]